MIGLPQNQQRPLEKLKCMREQATFFFHCWGPAYFGFMHSPYVVLVVWSAACAAIFFWSNRASLRHARQVAYGTYPVPLPYMVFFTGLLYVACCVGFLSVYSVLYFVAKLLT
jgi:hypothetical protein